MMDVWAKLSCWAWKSSLCWRVGPLGHTWGAMPILETTTRQGDLNFRLGLYTRFPFRYEDAEDRGCIRAKDIDAFDPRFEEGPLTEACAYGRLDMVHMLLQAWVEG